MPEKPTSSKTGNFLPGTSIPVKVLIGLINRGLDADQIREYLPEICDDDIEYAARWFLEHPAVNYDPETDVLGVRWGLGRPSRRQELAPGVTIFYVAGQPVGAVIEGYLAGRCAGLEVLPPAARQAAQSLGPWAEEVPPQHVVIGRFVSQDAFEAGGRRPVGLGRILVEDAHGRPLGLIVEAGGLPVRTDDLPMGKAFLRLFKAFDIPTREE